MRSTRLYGYVVVLFGSGVALAQPAVPKAALTEMVAMRDGTHLGTDVYLPGGGQGRWPALLVRTPYNKNLYNREYGPVAQKGYAVVVQDMRGRFASEGIDIAFLDCGWGEQQDGADTIRWIAQQPWCDGKVGTLGASAMGITQNMLARSAPPALVAQYILVGPPSMYHHAAYTSGAVRLEAAMSYLMGNAFDPANIWLAVLHPMYDEHWRRVNAIPDAGKTVVPAVHYGGWYDCFLTGTIAAFRARQEHGGPGSRGTQKLVIGAWGHGGPGSDAAPKRIGDVYFPPNSRKLPNGLDAMTWFDHYLKGKDNGADRVPAVSYYTMGAIDEPGAPGNVWHTEDVWPPAGKPLAMYLSADGTLGRERPAASDGSRTFTFDPRNSVPTHGGANLSILAGMCDQRENEKRPDVLVFTSEPLEEPVEVTGPVKASLFVSTDRPDTDFAVMLCDVYPDGRSMVICDGLLRARHRKGVDRLDLLKSGEVVKVDVELSDTSIVFNRGHRIRVHVTSSNFPRFDVNPNTGWPAWPFCPMQKARNTVYCSAERASFIELPVVRR